MQQAGDMPIGFWSFFNAFYIDPQHYFSGYESGIWPHIDVNHLWFVRSLWQFSVILLLLAPILLGRWGERFFTWLIELRWLLIVVSIASVIIIELLITGEQKREIYGLYFLGIGFLFGNNMQFWRQFKLIRKPLTLAAGITIFSLQLVFSIIWSTELFQQSLAAKLTAIFVYACAKVLPVFAILALASYFLNRQSERI